MKKIKKNITKNITRMLIALLLVQFFFYNIANSQSILDINTSSSTESNGQIKVQMFNLNRTPEYSLLSPVFNICNTGNVEINLSDIKLRYYYTVNGEVDQLFEYSSPTLVNSCIMGNFSQLDSCSQGADCCLEISFTSEAGVLLPGGNVEVQSFVHKSNWEKYNQADDYSFNSSDSGYIDWTKVTGYIGGKLAWGVEPVSTPGNVIAIPYSNSMTLSWDEVQNATGYELETDGVVIEVPSNNYIHANLIPGTSHTYRVRGKTGTITGPWSSYINRATLIDTPSNIKRETSDSQIRLLWDRVDGALSYDVEVDGQIVNTGLENVYELNNLEPGTVCNIRIRARGMDADSEWTDMMTICTLPDVPSNISATQTSSTITLSWEPSAGATGYDVEVYGTIVDNGNSTSYTHIDLEPNTQRTYRVRSKNESGVSPWSNVKAVSTLPGTAYNIKIGATDSSLNITWDNQAGADEYEIEVDGTNIVEVNENSYIHNGLLSNTQHTYRVRAKNTDGYSEWSPLEMGTTLLPVPDGFNISDITSNRIYLSWDQVTGATGYELEVDGEVIYNHASTSFIHSSLEPNSEHIYRVRALNESVVGGWTREIRQSTLLPAPKGLNALPEGSNMRLEWDMVIGAENYEIDIDGSPINVGASTEYIATDLYPGITHTFKVRALNRDGAGDWSVEISKASVLGLPSNIKTFSTSSSITVTWEGVEGANSYDVMVDGIIVNNGNSTEFTHTSLEPNTNHTYMVRAKNEECIGEWSSAVSVFTVLGIPSNVAIHVAGTAITISWDEVDGAESYDVLSDGNLVTDITDTVYMQDKLEPNTLHTFKVRAKNRDCMGEWCTEISQLTGPAVPPNIKAYPEMNQIRFTWDTSEGAVNYEIEIDGEIYGAISEPSFIYKNLEPNTRHECRIRARNVDGVYSEWSNLLKVNTLDQLTVNVEQDTGFNFVISVPKKQGISGYDIILNYDPDEVEVVDLYAATPRTDIETGMIQGSSIEIKEFTQGKAVYHVDSPDKSILVIVKFISKVTKKTNMSYKVDDENN